MTKIRVGILFGGISREREVSFAGGRTVFDNLDKSIFDAIPIFVDSFNQLIILDWHYIYKGSIRDFYPPVKHIPKSEFPFQIYAEQIQHAESIKQKMAAAIGKVLHFNELKKYIDFAFLALHGMHGEDGTIQGMLELLGIPYSGSGILPSAIGMNKNMQKHLMQANGMHVPKFFSIRKNDLEDLQKHFNTIKEKIGLPFVVKPANQGSSVGVSVITNDNLKEFENAVLKAFFILKLSKTEWQKMSKHDRFAFIQKIADVKEGIGLPAFVNGELIYHPESLLKNIDAVFKNNNFLTIESIYSETECLVESFIDGREFSCIVIRNNNGKAVALPPTEIVKGNEVFDYKSKYMPGLSRKITPINIPDEKIENIRTKCVELFDYFKFHVYARIDGFIDKNGNIFLNDPNTTSGMMPSSFFFHQAAEIGLNPSKFLTYIIRTSLIDRIESQPINYEYNFLLKKLDKQLTENKKSKNKKIRVAVIMGGYSTERHISVESGRNIYEKLASSEKYEPFPVFITGNDEAYKMWLLPINMMLKDNADDIKEKLLNYKQAPIMKKIANECKDILNTYNSVSLFEPKEITFKELKNLSDAVFIALHGRPGEDGTIQKELDKLKIPYNGSGADSSKITINKFDTNQLLKKKGFNVAEQLLITKEEYVVNAKAVIQKVEKIGYPLIAKPADDGCSSAVKKIKNKSELIAYAEGVFRNEPPIPQKTINTLNLKPKEEFPAKSYFLIEKFIEKGNAKHFLEVTGGMLTHYKNGKIYYETFEPSETLAEGEVLSLEEKFLAGQGQNLTPARFDKNPKTNAYISKLVQTELKKVAKTLNVQGYCRIDAFVKIYSKTKIEVFIIEINSLPGMTPATAIFHQCALNGYKPYEFIDAILTFGSQRIKN
ncbi:MAG: D-alanine--D-alanine ligase [Bacteroidia bacterium]